MIRPQGQQGENSRRVFMLQLDAVDQSFIKDNFDQLPNLRQVFENGQFVSTRSTSKLLEASAWASFASASDPGVHGQYFPLQWDPKTMSMRRATDPHWGARLDYEPFWYELGRDGYRCVVFDANEIFEHKNPPVLEISNWSSQESGKVFSSDPFTLQELNRRFGRRPIGKEVPIRKSIRLSTRLRDGLVDSVRRKCDAIIWLSDQRPWDFYVACVYDLHRAGHNLWPSASKEHSSSLPDAALLDVFKAFDAKLKEILDHIGTPATAVIIYTLHGMAENQSQNHLMPEIMRRLNHQFLEEEFGMERVLRNPGLIFSLRRMLPGGLQYYLAHLLGEQVQDWVVTHEWLGALEWDHTCVFTLPSADSGYIRFNLKGRELNGLLPNTDTFRSHLTSWLTEQLMAIRVSETGNALVKKCIRVGDIFPGPRSHMLPDLLVQWKPSSPVTEVQSEAIGVIKARLQTGRNGNHSGESFAIMIGNLPHDDCVQELQAITDYDNLVRRLLSQ